MHLHIFTAKPVDEPDHLLRGEQVAVEENVLHVQVNLQFLGRGQQLLDSGPGALVADVVRCGIVILTPRHVHRAGHHEQVFRAQMVGSLGHQPG